MKFRDYLIVWKKKPGSRHVSTFVQKALSHQEARLAADQNVATMSDGRGRVISVELVTEDD